MPKLKSRKGLRKRLWVTKTGAVKRLRPFRSHLMSTKRGKRVRQLRKSAFVEGRQARTYKRMMLDD